MRSLSCIAVIGVCFANSGCGSSVEEPQFPVFDFERQYIVFEQQLREERDQLKVRSYNELTGREKIFLVAGGSDSANFAQEVIDQRRHWMNMGFSADEIACFYVRPTLTAMYQDWEQYRLLSDELSHCFAANTQVIRYALHLASILEPDFIYFYSSSHGAPPMSLASEILDSKHSEKLYSEVLQRFPHLDQYWLVYDGSSIGDAFNRHEVDEMIAAGEEKKEDFYFSPEVLKGLLNKPGFSKTQKIIILQACFSGGFLESPEPKFQDQTLTSVSYLTLITAARFDRTSFGCDVGSQTTVFGGEFNHLISTHLHSQIPVQIDWSTLYSSLERNIRTREMELNLGDKPSLPQYFSNRISAHETDASDMNCLLPP